MGIGPGHYEVALSSFTARIFELPHKAVNPLILV